MSDASSLPVPPDWAVRYSEHFEEQLVSRRYRQMRDVVRGRLGVLFRDPYRAARAERLRTPYRGLRSARVNDEGVRLIYRLCEECRREGEQRLRPLDCCMDGSTEDRTVNVLCLSEHYAGIPDGFVL